MIIITIGAYTGDDMPDADGKYIERLHERVAQKWPELEFSITLKDGELTKVEWEPTIDAPTEGAEPPADAVYQFVMDQWVEYVLEEEADEEN